jgi:3-deoxy-7-phosphoheptulonate synthase
LRGGAQSGPNYRAESVAATRALLAKAGVPERVMIDASHGNSEKDPQRQVDVVDAVLQQKRAGDRTIRALMIESHLVGGRQDLGSGPLTRGQSITDACLSFDATDTLIRGLAERLARR